MTKYKCGHKSDIIIMNESIMALSSYLTWKDISGFDGDKTQCFDCYLKETTKEVGG